MVDIRGTSYSNCLRFYQGNVFAFHFLLLQGYAPFNNSSRLFVQRNLLYLEALKRIQQEIVIQGGGKDRPGTEVENERLKLEIEKFKDRKVTLLVRTKVAKSSSKWRLKEILDCEAAFLTQQNKISDIILLIEGQSAG